MLARLKHFFRRRKKPDTSVQLSPTGKPIAGGFPLSPEQQAVVAKQMAHNADRGGYGGLCIPGDDLPDSIPRIDGPPTMAMLKPFIGCENGAPRIYVDRIERVEVNYESPKIRPASITNGYDRDIVLEGSVLRLHLKAGETRAVDGTIFQVTRHPTRPEEGMIKGMTPFAVLTDMAAERTRSMLRNHNTESRDPDQVTVGRLLEISKFTVREL